MTKNQCQIILGELSLYSQRQQKAISAEFHRRYPGRFSKKIFLEFLRKKLDIEEYWESERWLKL
jgi:hypothetical protein